jgi:uncharacterized delta-60 repeat protein
MRRFLRTVFLILCFLLASTPRAQVWQEWLRIYDGSAGESDLAYAIAADAQGNILITGESEGIGSMTDCVTLKYNPLGVLLWQARYDGPAGEDDRGYTVAVDDSGNAYVAGAGQGIGTGFDFFLVKYDPDGYPLWEARYDGCGGYDRVRALAVHPAGGAVITGESESAGADYDYATIRCSAAGVVLWTARYDGPGNGRDLPAALVLDGQGNIYVTGSSAGSGTLQDWATLKYDSQGQLQWAARFNSADDADDDAVDLAVDDAGNVYVAGIGEGYGTRQDITVVKYNPQGQELWSDHYNGPGGADDVPNAVRITADGDILVTGRSWSAETLYDFTVIRYTPQGMRIWLERFNGPQGYDWPNGTVVDANDNIYMTGFTNGPHAADYFTIKVSPSGNLLWFITYSGPGAYTDIGNGVALSDDGSVYVTGSGWLQGGWDYVTVKYTQSGPPTPIQLAAFDARLAAAGVELSWTTAAEIGCYGWIVQRREKDGIFQDISDFIPGGGTTTEPHTYAYTDRQIQPGRSYDYRLAQIALDGAVTTSDPVAVEIPAAQTVTLQDLFPNPCGDQLSAAASAITLTFTLPQAAKVQLEMFDLQGKQVEISWNHARQEEWYAAGRHAVVLTGKEFAAGVYFIRLTATPQSSPSVRFTAVQKLAVVK